MNLFGTKKQFSFLETIWKLATFCGMRRLGDVLKTTYPSAYDDTIFYVQGGKVALTIDDGICRQNRQLSMLTEVIELLNKYDQAHATFFICTEYTNHDDIQCILQHGHEIGNHLKKDLSNYHCNLSTDTFRKELTESNQFIKDCTGTKPIWFRAPQGRVTAIMNKVLKEEGMVNVLGDCYCDDWALGERKGSDQEVRQQGQQSEEDGTDVVASLMLRQVHTGGGSIAVFHVPERGFRQHCLVALEKFLIGVKEKNLKVISVSEMNEIKVSSSSLSSSSPSQET